MLKLIIAVIAMTATSGAASAQKYYMRAALPEGAFTLPSEPVDNNVYLWSRPTDPSNSKLCIAGIRTTAYINQCYYEANGKVIVAPNSKCPAPEPEVRPTDYYACSLNCSTLRASRIPPTPGTFIGTASNSVDAQKLCNQQVAQNGICYRDTTTNRVTWGNADPLTLLTSTKATDTAIYCGAS
jgi:hypothetical protein